MKSNNGGRSFADPAIYEPTRLPVSEATTLIPDAYTDADFFEEEVQSLWRTSWVCVGYECQIQRPGDILKVDCVGESLLLVRDKNEKINGFYNVCRHRGAQLIQEESAHCSVIRCPYHGWGYSLEGRLLGAPYFQGLDIPASAKEQFRIRAEEQGSFCKSDYGLHTVNVDVWGGMVFVNLDPNAAPLKQWLGDLPERFCRHPLGDLQLVRRKHFEIQANWKLVAENFMEYYHLPSVHPELCNISGFDNHHRYQGPGMYTGMCTSPLSVDPDTVRLDLPNFPGLDPTESCSAYFIMLFPNIALWIFPNHLVTLLFHASGSDLTLENLDILVHPSTLNLPETDTQLDQIAEFWCMVNQQDIGIVESVQKGLKSGPYSGGRMCYEFEEPVHRFQNMVIDRMLGVERVPAGDEEA